MDAQRDKIAHTDADHHPHANNKHDTVAIAIYHGDPDSGDAHRISHATHNAGPDRNTDGD